MSQFQWDEKKAEANWRKHGIRFEQAASVFEDPNRITDVDNRYDYGEERMKTTGMSEGLLLLVVAHTTREADETEVVRIISARCAEPLERKRYGNRNF